MISWVGLRQIGQVEWIGEINSGQLTRRENSEGLKHFWKRRVIQKKKEKQEHEMPRDFKG
jgi:hypothetical protein